jgi:peptidoglycan hydrolase-like protein with peptidoglycan-binding domain
METGKVLAKKFLNTGENPQRSLLIKRIGSFYKGDIDGKMSDELEQTIRVIQERNNLEPTGKLDEATRNKIQEEHGS